VTSQQEQIAQRRELNKMIWGFAATQIISVATRWRVVDQFGDGERTPAELAAVLDAPEHTTRRLLRAMAAHGLLTETGPDSFAVAPMGALLRSDDPTSAYRFARMFTDPTMWRAWERLDDGIHTGRTMFDEVFGTDYFDHLKTEPEISAIFNSAMSTMTERIAPLIATSTDFSRFGTVADVGGGSGALLAGILAEHPHLRGMLVDSAAGLAEAPELLAKVGVAQRCTLAESDFFVAVPAGADAYVLKSIVHDWDDERAATILANCRAAMPADGRLVIVEPVLPNVVPAEAPAGLYLSDLNMLVNVGGRERTLADFEDLCAAAGFTMIDNVPLPPTVGYSVIVATPA